MGDFLGQFGATGYWLVSYLIPFLIVLTIVVFFHELGHFSVARWNGVDVEAFSIGFGKELVGFNDRRGTRWKLCAVPLGGYVKFSGDANAASVPDFEQANSMDIHEREGSFVYKSVAQRAAIVVAGPLANFILAIVIFTLSFMILGRVIADPVIAEVRENSAAQSAGLQPGDIIRRIDGVEIESFGQIPMLVGPNAGIELDVKIERDGTPLNFKITPREKEITDQFGNPQKIGLIGITNNNEVGNYRVVKFGLVEAFAAGSYETWFIIERTMVYLKNIVFGNQSADQLGGPIRIAKMSGDVATLGFGALINLAAILSVSIGLINLFPIPLLDGGHLVFYAIEAVRGKPLSEKTQGMGFTIGMTLIISLMLFTTFNDVNFLSKLL